MTTKGKSITFVTVAAILLWAVPGWFTTSAENQGATVWGTWHFVLDIGPGATIPGVITLHRDGTLTIVDGTDFGGAPFPFKNSAGHGVWIKTGANTFENRNLELNFDPFSGQLTSITLVRATFHFDGDFDHLSGEAVIDSWLCPTPFTCPDPLTAAPDIPGVDVITFRATRLRVE